MKGNNTRLLTDAQHKAYNNTFEITLSQDERYVNVKSRNLNRITLHPIDKSFVINSPIRKITFSVQAIAAWIELLKEGGKWTLVDVQQACMALQVTYQPYTIQGIKHMLAKTETETD